MRMLRQFLALWVPEQSDALPRVSRDAPANEQLLARWTREGTEPQPPEPAERVRQVFRALGFEATPDVLALYGAIGGMLQPCNALWRLWPLEEVMAQPPSEHGVEFSDYMWSCWNYRVRPVSDEHSAVYIDYYDGKPHVLVAASLDEFLERYLADADALLDG
ncbi:hypothetical protein [Roseateles sp. LYH14W]|uniref:SMI1/KNR4 family protein n=1 Tax=Pelomonas parva TaxID=3299032 RepID=A0ABW7F2B2_9BURK